MDSKAKARRRSRERLEERLGRRGATYERHRAVLALGASAAVIAAAVALNVLVRAFS